MRIRTAWRRRRRAGKVNEDGLPSFLVLRGKKRPSEGEEGMGQSTQGDVVMKPSPPSALEVVEAHLSFHILIISFHAPAKLGEPDERTLGHPSR
jgi:hypothetical protein